MNDQVINLEYKDIDTLLEVKNFVLSVEVRLLSEGVDVFQNDEDEIQIYAKEILSMIEKIEGSNENKGYLEGLKYEFGWS